MRCLALSEDVILQRDGCIGAHSEAKHQLRGAEIPVSQNQEKGICNTRLLSDGKACRFLFCREMNLQWDNTSKDAPEVQQPME